MKTDFSVRGMAFTALMAALICVAAPFVIPLGAVPLSLATFAVYLAGALLGGWRGAAAVCIYLLIGAVGLPVFSGFAGGLGQLFGVTGGFLVGYIPCALMTGLFCDSFPQRGWSMALGMALGTLCCYALGVIWYTVLTGADIPAALAVCVVPFLPADGLKIAAACGIAAPLKKRLREIER